MIQHPTPGIYSEKAIIWKATLTPVLNAALFTSWDMEAT